MRLNALEIRDNLLEQRKMIRERLDLLNRIVSESDKKLVDLDHLTEFYEFNASQMCKINKLRRDVLRERREAKDESSELRPLMDMTNQFTYHSKASKEMERQSSLHNSDKAYRKYKVRILNELLGDFLTEENKPEI